MTVSDEIFKRNADAYRRIRNTSRFLLANLSGFDPSKDMFFFFFFFFLWFSSKA